MKNRLKKFFLPQEFTPSFLGSLIAFSLFGMVIFTIIYTILLIERIRSGNIKDFSTSILPEVKYWILAIVILSILFSLYFRLNPYSENFSNEKKLSQLKSDYLSKILDKLTLQIDKDLEKSLNTQSLEDAHYQIKDVIQSFDRIIEIFTGKQAGVLKGTDINSLASFYESTTLRINKEINRQKWLSWLNLCIGITTSIIAIYFLLTNFSTKPTSFYDLAPRISIPLLIEIFSFYFLNLYRKNQDEIKFWNNEKTNLDLKLFALSMVIDDEEINDKEFMQKTAMELLKTERNNTLRKDETTVELEKMRLENTTLDSFLNKLSQVSDMINKK